MPKSNLYTINLEIKFPCIIKPTCSGSSFGISKVSCKNYVDKDKGVRGIAVVFKGYDSQIHYHPVAEEYDIFYGKGIMYLNGKTYKIEAPYKVWIPANVHHTIKATTPFLLMRYN